MFKPQSLEPLTKEFVLSRITEEDVFLKYMNIYPSLTGRYKSPLRNDSNAGCNFYRDSRGVLKFRDPAYRINIDCFNLVSLVAPEANSYGLVLKKIAEDFKLYEKEIDYSILTNWEEAVQIASKKLTIIQVKRKEFTKEELLWWQEQGVYKEVLNFYKANSIQILWLNGNIIYSYSRKDPCYVYHFGEYLYKAYFPNRVSYRFLQNIGKSMLEGYDQLPETGLFIVITNSLKCSMCMYSFDIPAGNPPSESTLLEEVLMIELQSRFTYVFTLFDRWKNGKTDKAGAHMSWLMRKKYGTIPLMFDKDEPKDFCDNYKKYGTSYMSELINEIKEQLL